MHTLAVLYTVLPSKHNNTLPSERSETAKNSLCTLGNLVST